MLLNPKDNNDKNKFSLYIQTNNDNKALLNEQKSSIPLFDLKDTNITENKALYNNKNNKDSKFFSIEKIIINYLMNTYFLIITFIIKTIKIIKII